ncbi:MAG: hypothetical protein ABIJ58_03235 [Nanoarchaeota archaeon]
MNQESVWDKYQRVLRLQSEVDSRVSSSGEFDGLYAWAHSVKLNLGTLRYVNSEMDRGNTKDFQLRYYFGLLDYLEWTLRGEMRSDI